MIPVELRVYNSFSIELAKNAAYNSRTRHIHVRYDYIPIFVEENWVKINHVASEE